MLAISMAIVVGPAPFGTGVMTSRNLKAFLEGDVIKAGEFPLRLLFRQGVLNGGEAIFLGIRWSTNVIALTMRAGAIG